MVQDLAISLNLNIAACALKLHDFHRALDLCSLVLEVDSNNVKALFRRAMAAKEIDLTNPAYHELAYHDLVKAAIIEQNNKDILRELQEAQKVIIVRGKRRWKNPENYVQGRKGRMVTTVEEGETSFTHVDLVVEVRNAPMEARQDQTRMKRAPPLGARGTLWPWTIMPLL